MCVFECVSRRENRKIKNKRGEKEIVGPIEFERKRTKTQRIITQKWDQRRCDFREL